MYIEEISPIIFTIGPLVVHGYGLAFAVSLLVGFYYLRKNGLKQGYSDDTLFTLLIVAALSLIIGARAVFVIVYWQNYADNLIEVLRIDHGGLAFHGGLLGGILGSWLPVS